MRYTAEIRLRLVGDTAECQQYISQARTVLGEVWNRDIELGEIDQSWRTVRLNDRTTVSVYATTLAIPLVTITVAPVEGGGSTTQPYLLELIWEPEGILLTPTTLEDPGGWGLPSRSGDETGVKLAAYTPGGALPQVLLNRFANNKYHDNPNFLAGGDIDWPELAPSYVPILTVESYATLTPSIANIQHRYARRSRQWASYSEPSETTINGHYIFISDLEAEALAPGVKTPDGAMLLEQDSVLEIEGDSWQAHRPEELLHPSELLEHVYQQTNVVRVAAGEEPVHRALRGEQNVARGTVANIVGSGDELIAHSYYGWRPGVRTAEGRNHAAFGLSIFGFFSNNGSENLQSFSPEGGTVVEQAEAIVASWVSSPSHYANIINAWWTEQPFYPWHPWVPKGTQSGQVNLASATGVTLSQTWVVSDDPYNYELEDITPAVENYDVWAQNFTTREAWLPVYSMYQEYAKGIAGLFGPTCPYTRDYYRTQRKFGYKATTYEIPEGNALPAWYMFGADWRDDDDFLTCLGCAPFERQDAADDPDADPITRTWIRGVFWRSSDAKYGNTYAIPREEQGLRWGELVVVIFPEGLGDSPVLPWAADKMPQEFEVEFEQRYIVQDGWVPESEGLVRFDSTGTKFTIELEKVGEEFITTGIGPFNDVDAGTRTTLEAGQFNVQRVPLLYEAAEVTELLPGRTPIRAEVTLIEGPWSRVVDIDGEYEIFPHFDAEDNIKFCTMLVRENWQQQGRAIGRVHDLNNPSLTEDDVNKGYRRYILRFPSGKEVVYMQQYLIADCAVNWTEDNVPPGYADYFPGDGQNFYAVIHELDEINEVMIYSKHTITTYWNGGPFTYIYREENTDTELGAEIAAALDDSGPYFPETSSAWTRGDSSYHLDAFHGTDRVQEGLAEYPGTQDVPLRVTSHDDFTVGRSIYVRDGIDLYTIGTTPSFGLIYFHVETLALETDWDGNVIYKAGTPYSLEETTLRYLPQTAADVENHYSFTNFRAPNSTDVGTITMQEFFGNHPVDDYDLSVTTRAAYFGEDNTGSTTRLRAGEQYYGKQGCGAYHNVAPMFSRENEVRAKFVHYKDRWVSRLEVRHINRGGLHITHEVQKWQEGTWFPGKYEPHTKTYNVPANATKQNPELIDVWWQGVISEAETDDFIKSLSGQFAYMGNYFNNNGTEVHLKANFDIDEAVGISDVTDIEPFGRMG